jgi:hypothetical protein
MNKASWALLLLIGISGISFAGDSYLDSLKSMSRDAAPAANNNIPAPTPAANSNDPANNANPANTINPADNINPDDTVGAAGSRYFNSYVLKAVKQLYGNYKLLGYDIHSVLTHNVTYYTDAPIPATNPPKTMCVAAQMEVILTAYQLYAQDTGDYSIYKYLPRESFIGLTQDDIKGHIWVNKNFNSFGTADALYNFGMGDKIPFEQLKPGSFVNINRTTGTGHAVTFIGYINSSGTVLAAYDPSVVGFEYFSSQGGAAAGAGGFDFRDAVFSQYGCPTNMPIKRDCNVIYSTDRTYLNTGMMLSPKYWQHPAAPKAISLPGFPKEETVLDEKFFDGHTTDD